VAKVQALEAVTESGSCESSRAGFVSGGAVTAGERALFQPSIGMLAARWFCQGRSLVSGEHAISRCQTRAPSAKERIVPCSSRSKVVR
jgi:hypothetical protein